MLRGIDISAVQGPIAWPATKAAMGLSFVIAKAAEGNRPARDPRFLEHVAGARAAGLRVGCYLFPYPLPPKPSEPLHDPVAQAKLHFDLSGGLGSQPGDLPPSVDAEWPAPQDWPRWGCSAPQLRTWLLAYLDAVEAIWGRKPMLYTYPSWWASLGGASDPRFASYGLWMASYQHPDRWPVDGAPVIPKPWTNWTMWQANGGTLKLPSGVPVDCDVYNGDEAGLAELCGATSASALAHVAIQQAAAALPLDASDPPPDAAA